MKTTIAICMAFALGQSAWAGHAIGNGGDHVRGMFLKVGGAVVTYLKETGEGADLVDRHSLDLVRLEGTLDAEKLSVVEISLTDSGGSLADATGEPGKITLRKDRWIDHFEKDRDVAYLVFHEMLRASEYVDDSFVISKAINPFPLSRRVITRIVPTVPLIGDDLIAPFVPLETVTIAGSGCPTGKVGTSFDFDTERNIVDVTFDKYVSRAGGVVTPRPLERKQCGFSIPVKLPPGKRLVISQLDILGETDLAPGAAAQLRSEAILGATSGAAQTKDIKATGTTRLVGKLLVRRTEVLKSKCGGSDLVRLNTSGYVTNPAMGQRPDLLEVRRISLYLRLEACR